MPLVVLLAGGGSGTMPSSAYGAGTYGASTYGAIVPPGALSSVFPTTLMAGSSTTTLTFSGTNTTWLTTPPVITSSGGALGVPAVVSDGSLTVSYTPPISAQTVTFTDTTDNSSKVTLSVTPAPVRATLSRIAPGVLLVGSGPVTVAFTGTGTTWLTAVPTIAVSAGSLGAITATTNTAASATFTPPVSAQNVTFTDSTDSSSVVIVAIIAAVTIPAQVPGMPPGLVVECSFSTNPGDPPVWVDITSFVERVSVNRGRQRELDRVQAGVMTLDLSNRDRRFDPTYSGGPYYPNVLPMRRIRARATYANSGYPEFSGYVESWGQHWNTWQDAVVPVTCTDAFKVLNLAQLNTSFPAQVSDARVTAVLNAVGWQTGAVTWTLNTSLLNTGTILGPTGDKVITPGSSTIQASTLTNTSALSHLQDVADTEMGLLFTDRDGAINFYGRGYTINTASQATFGETVAAGELPYVTIELSYDDTNIWNQIQITPQGGSQQTANDLPSQAEFYVRTLSKTGTLHNSDGDALSIAMAMVNKYSQPSLQVTAMTLDGEANPALIYPQMLGREIGERVTVRRRPAWGGMIEQVSLIQGISLTYEAAGGIWSVTWRLAPVSTATYWKLNDPVQSILGVSTRVFF